MQGFVVFLVALCLAGSGLSSSAAGDETVQAVSERLRGGEIRGFRLGDDIRTHVGRLTTPITEKRVGGRIVEYSGLAMNDAEFLETFATVSLWADAAGLIHTISFSYQARGEIGAQQVEEELAWTFGPPTSRRVDEQGQHWISWRGENDEENLLLTVEFLPDERRTRVRVTLSDRRRAASVPFG